MSAPWSCPRVLPLEEIPTAAPGLRFAVRFVEGATGSAAADALGGVSGERHRTAGDAVRHGADRPHPLAGTGKLFLAAVVACLAERDPGLLASPLTVRGEHRAAARAGTLRRMTGDLQLTVDDAMALMVGTGDGACTVALLELLEGRGVDLLAEAHRLTAELGLDATAFTALEDSVPGEDEGRTGQSWGEGLLGTTTPADLCALLVRLVGSAAPLAVPAAGFADQPDADASALQGLLGPRAADRVLGWMGKTFEPAGLASALPGSGPRTVLHRTVSGVELLTPAGALGCASVLILPAGVGNGQRTKCVAAYHPRTRADGSAIPAREAMAVLGSIGLAAAVARR